MSKLVVEVCTIDSVVKHPNADALDLVNIKGWQCVTQKGLRQTGQKVVYVPVDSMIPIELADKMEITKYLAGVTSGVDGPRAGRVRCAKLRGEPSFGVIMECADPSWEVGLDVTEHYGITKYIPTVKLSAGDAEVPAPNLHKYTEIENLRNFTNIFETGEEVVVTEKIHGSNCKVGVVDGEWMASSNTVRRRKPADDQLATNIYWFPTTLPSVQEMITDLSAKGHQQVVLYGEVYGKVQSLTYGKPGALGFVAFDLMIDGKYLPYEGFKLACIAYRVPMAPLLAVIPYSIEAIKELSGGLTTMPGAAHIREGVVIKPIIERHHPRYGRVIAKYIGDQYLLKKEDGKVTDCVDA